MQSINYPTVARGEERLRITVTPRHTVEQMDKLVAAVDRIFSQLGINRTKDWKLAGGRAGVGMPDGIDHVEPMWNDAQLGLLDGTTPPTLHEGQKAAVDAQAVAQAREVFDPLLGPITGPLQATRTTHLQYELVSRTAPKQKLPKMQTGGVPLSRDIPVPPPAAPLSV